MHEDNVNVLLFELPMTDCGGEALKVLAMISLEEECENYKKGFIMTNNPKFPLMRTMTSFGSQGEKLVNEGPVVELSTTPMNGNMGCQPEVP